MAEKVFFTSTITPKSLIEMYDCLCIDVYTNKNMAVKVSTGEPGGHNFLDPNLIKPLVKKINGTIVECNTAYEGKRSDNENHWDTIRHHGFMGVARCDIMDEDGDIRIPVYDGFHLKENYVGEHIRLYDRMLVLSHFKGHAMAGFGGALKNLSIGVASARGKALIHTAGKGTKGEDIWNLKTPQNAFLESMVDADMSVMNFMGKHKHNIIYINVANNLSIDCDSHPKDPEIEDIGIFASLDPVALDQACIDAVYDHPNPKKKSLIERIESRNGLHILEAAEKKGLGSRNYQLVNCITETEDIFA